MGNDQERLANQCSDALLAADVVIWGSVALNYQGSNFQSITMQALLPFASMFIYESLGHLGLRHSVLNARFGASSDYVKSGRHRVKLLDGTSFSEALEVAHRIAHAERHEYLAPHSGRLRSWRQKFQPDLGLLFLGGRLVATSHSTLISIGAASNQLPSHSDFHLFMYDFGVSLGQHLRLLLTHTGVMEQDMILPGEPREITFTDVKWQQFVTLTAGRIAPTRGDVCLFLLSVSAYVNAARFLVPIIAKNSELGALKIHLVSLFHAVSSLNRLLAANREQPFLSVPTAINLQEALSHPSLKRNKERRALRNALVHYRIEDRYIDKLSKYLPFSGLVEAHVPGATLDSLSRDVQIGLDHLSETVHALLFPNPVHTRKL